MANTASSSETVVGLATFLESRWLGAYLPAAERYCEEIGAVHVDEVLDDLEELAAELKLKKAEVKRLFGEARPPLAKPAAPAAPVAAEPAAPVEEKTPGACLRAPVAPAPPAAPVEKPSKKAWADTESDSDAEDSTEEAASTTQSSVTAPPMDDSWEKVVAKKTAKAVSFSDTASVCLSEVSTAPSKRPSGALLCKSTLTLHESDVGRLLRKSGAAIKRIEAATGAKVSVQKRDQRRGEEVPVVFQGASKEVVDRAIELLKLDLLEADSAKPEESAQTMLVNSADAGILLGSGGETIKKIQSSTRTQISVSKEGAQRTVLLRGANAAAIAAAKAQIADALKQVERTVEVPDWAVGEILGRGGVALMQLQKDTGARIEVPKEGEIRLVKIRARTEAKVAAAEKAIAAILSPQEHVIDDLTSEEAGALIGKKGAMIKEIQKYSGARVTISSEGPYRTATISAPTIKSINMAINAMQQVIREAR